LAERKPYFFTKSVGKSQGKSDLDITGGQDTDPLLVELPMGYMPI